MFHKHLSGLSQVVGLTTVVKTMESRLVPGLYRIGEILDCDGWIGGFNFQWAWATGFISGWPGGRAL